MVWRSGKTSRAPLLVVTLNKICIHVTSSARPATALVLAAFFLTSLRPWLILGQSRTND